jgi:hypothetical protein
MSLRVVLYAEGGNETTGQQPGLPPRPGDLGAAPAQPKEPERMARREAKGLLASWMGERDEQAARISLAGMCDLDVVRRRCSAFDQFLRDLGGARL